MKGLAEALEARRREGLYRRRRTVSGAVGAELTVDGRRLLAFCSNDYLGLAGDPRIERALAACAADSGTGSGASHLVCGHHREHHALEEELAEFTGRPRALLFSSGYLANFGTIAALTGRHDRLFSDRLNHASLIDGCRLSGATVHRYRHADAAALSERLAADGGDGRRLAITDGVFSMDGDIAPLPELATACRAHDAWLMVDDAHGIGVVGDGGRGSVAAAGLDVDDVPVLVGTLGKAFGTSGAFVAGSELLIETLIQHARSYIYTTAMPPAIAAATRASLRIVRDESWRRERLQELIARFRSGARQLGLQLLDSDTPIQPILVGEPQRALELAAGLEAQGLLVTAIRPPTVPAGTARLRVTLSAAHDADQVDRLLDALGTLRA